MSYYDDYYDEPSEFEQQIDDFKSSLAEAVKKEHREEIERLRKENASLQDIKNRTLEIEKEHAATMARMETERSQLESRIRRERLNELLSDNFIQGWGVEDHGEKLPKCDKCDENRYITYKTPSGKDAKEHCDCDTRTTNYEPISVECYRFVQTGTYYGGESCRINKYYRRRPHRDYDEYEVTYDMYEGESFKVVRKNRVIFLNKEKCQEYCDWLNQKEGAK